MAKRIRSDSWSVERWEKDEDVRSLARARAIHNDPERHNRAKLHAKAMLDENKEAKQNALNKVDEAQAAIDLAESKS